MKTKFILSLLLSLTLLLNACSSLTTIVSSSGQQPTPIESSDTPTPSDGYQTITVDDVNVEVGVGSPIPVFVHINGNLPDPCSQVEQTEIRQDGTNFIISLFATPDMGGPAVDSCIKDPTPFKMSIPLSVVDLPAGTYSATVNGVRAEFELKNDSTTTFLMTADLPISKGDIPVDNVSVEVGIGSPIPVHAVVSANLPSYCAQLGEVRLHRDGNTFFVQLLSYRLTETECNSDTLPIRLNVPLNIINLPEGTYEVNVNGVTTTFKIPVQ